MSTWDGHPVSDWTRETGDEQIVRVVGYILAAQLADSEGLTDFGRKVIAECKRRGLWEQAVVDAARARLGI